jgi:hypothetical protein
MAKADAFSTLRIHQGWFIILPHLSRRSQKKLFPGEEEERSEERGANGGRGRILVDL